MIKLTSYYPAKSGASKKPTKKWQTSYQQIRIAIKERKLQSKEQQPNQPRATVDVRNEPASLGGRADVKGAGTSMNKTKPATALTTDPNLQLPDPNHMYVLFPGLEAMEEKEALDYLFGLDPYPSTSKLGKAK